MTEPLPGHHPQHNLPPPPAGRKMVGDGFLGHLFKVTTLARGVCMEVYLQVIVLGLALNSFDVYSDIGSAIYWWRPKVVMRTLQVNS
jgi:hypothetical protein